MLRSAPILPFTSFKLFVVDSSAKSLKRMGKAERIGSQIVVDVSFNQDIAMKPLRLRKDAQRGQARPEPVHFIVRKSPLRHQ